MSTWLVPALLSMAFQLPFLIEVLADPTIPYVVSSPAAGSTPFSNSITSVNSPGIFLPPVTPSDVSNLQSFQVQPQLPECPINRVPTDVVRDFTSYFVQLVQADQKVNDAFAIRRLTADEAANIIHDFSLAIQTNNSNLDPEGTAKNVQEAVKKNFERVNAESLIRIYGNTAGTMKFNQGVLNAENAADEARKYFETVKDLVNSVAQPSAEADLKATAQAYWDFAYGNGVPEQERDLLGARTFINEWLIL